MASTSLVKILFQTYIHPRRALDALSKLDTPHAGFLYAFARGLCLSLLFYLPFFLLKFQPITPAYLAVFDSPDYFLYAALMWPLFGVLSWLYLSAPDYLILRLLKYPVNFDQLLNLGGLLNLAIGIVILLFDWVLVFLGMHTDPAVIGIAHILIADPWSIVLTAYFYKKHFQVPVWLSILLGLLTRLLYFPLALVFIRT
jgi:hypothetical protein